MGKTGQALKSVQMVKGISVNVRTGKNLWIIFGTAADGQKQRRAQKCMLHRIELAGQAERIHAVQCIAHDTCESGNASCLSMVSAAMSF